MSNEDEAQALFEQVQALNANIWRQNERLNELTGVLVDISAILEQIERSMNSLARAPR